ncbi:MAG: hypothetical protein RL071_1449 [Pseudomonadota bacterium]|jgi:hypothetical protein
MSPCRTVGALFALQMLLPSAALADEGAPSTGGEAAEPAEGAPPAALPPEALSTATAPAPLGKRQLDWLEPKRSQLDQNPYGSTDFTAYTLELGEWRVGLGSVGVGALPRTHLSVSPPLYALGIVNGAAKVNLVRIGPVDLALGGQAYRLGIGEFSGRQLGAGAMSSVRLTAPWSLHVGGQYNMFSATGLPDLSDPPLLLGLAAPDLANYQEQVSGVVGGAPLDVTARSVTMKVATDVRFNRRDSLVLQASGMVWSEVDSEVSAEQLPPLMNLDKALAGSSSTPLRDSYVASLAWQFSWKRADLRVGGGVSSVPGAWLLQSTELAWRLGGPTRSSERRMRATWRENRRDALRGGSRRGADDGPRG